MERIILIAVLVFGAFFVPSILRRVEIFRLSRRVRDRNLVIGLSIYLGGTEGNYFNDEACAAFLEMEDHLRSLGVKIGALHPRAAIDLRNEHFWLNRIADTNVGRADLIVVGDWRIWGPMYGVGPVHYSLHALLFRNNGWEIRQKKTMRLSLSKIRPSWLTHRRLTEQVLLVILRGLASTLNRPALDPGFRYDASEWPYSEASSSNIV